MADENTQTTLRDTLSQAFESVEAEVPAVVKTEVEATESPETPQQKAERLRDEKGRFAEGKKETKEIPAVGKKSEAPIVETKPRPQRPSSWKKDMWDHWEKLDPQVAEYVNQREQEFAKGVSTYKQEWESAKPLQEAMAQFQPILQQYGIKPEQWISNLGNAHQQLVMGTPDQKLSMFVKLAQDYQVPLQSLFTQGQDGKVYFNPQIQSYQAPQPRQEQTDPRQIVKQVLEEERANQEVQSFVNNEQYPYFEQVKETMAGLLQAGLAKDLKGAYEASLRMPMHTDIFDELQKQQQAKTEQEKREQAQRAVTGAKAKAVSVKSSTPVGTSTKANSKGLRGQLEDAFDEVVPQRV